MNMTLIFEISIARAQKGINSMQVQWGGSQPPERPERHSRIYSKREEGKLNHM